MKKLLLLLLLALSFTANAQNFTGFVKDYKTHKPLDYASVVAMDSNGNPVAFRNTGEDGSFSLQVTDSKVVRSLSVSYLGFAQKTITVSEYKPGMTIYMHQDAIEIKEVEVKSKRLQQRSDTLIYSVAGFRQKQDRSIADVIAKMPGLDVSDKGTITYQGKPINKFYIEGMDLMGGKYAMASENLSAKKVKNVEVLRNHQPIKALKGIHFSDQAALNLILEDEAKEVLNGLIELGAGAQVQKGIGNDFLCDGRAVSMLFGRKHQNLSMYKWNNTGKDIQHEIRDLTSSSDLEDSDVPWINDIAVSAPDLKLERYNCNNTHIAATNWLFKTGKNADLRLQGTYLFDKTIGYRKDQTTYTNILGQPVMDESYDANKYRREANVEVLYKQNQDSLYLENSIKASINWNESAATTMLNGSSIRQDVQPRKRGLNDNFNLIKKLGNGRSFNLNAMVDYRYLPGRLLTVSDSIPQKLNVKTLNAKVSTGFRHRLLGMYISYDAQLGYKNDDIELVNGEPQKVNYREVEMKVTPRVSFEKYGIRSSLSVPCYLAFFHLAGNEDYKFFVNPYFFIGYKLSGTWDTDFYYNHQYTCFGISNNVPMTYFVDYTTRIKGSGKLDFTSLDSYNGKLEYSNPNIGLFFNLSGSYVKTNDVPMPTYDYRDNVYTMQSLDLKSRNEQMRGSAEISKAFGYGKTTFTLGGDVIQNNYSTWISEKENHCHLQFYSAHFKFAFMPSTVFSLEEYSAFNSMKSKNTTNPELTTKATNSFNHKLTMFFMPGNWQFSWAHELYHSNDKSVNTAYFSDFKVTWTQKRYELSLGVNNIFGTTKYERMTISTDYMQYSYNRLRPREVMAKVSFSL